MDRPAIHTRPQESLFPNISALLAVGTGTSTGEDLTEMKLGALRVILDCSLVLCGRVVVWSRGRVAMQLRGWVAVWSSIAVPV